MAQVQNEPSVALLCAALLNLFFSLGTKSVKTCRLWTFRDDYWGFPLNMT